MNANQENFAECFAGFDLVGNDPDRYLAFRKTGFLLLAIFVCLTGCGFEGMDDDGFGRIRSNSGYGTIDGISGFVHILKSRGLDVNQSSRISPLIERYDTIIWAPDRQIPPSDRAIERLQQWVDGGLSDRRLIFVGPGFRGRKLLDKKQIELADDAEKERAIRRRNEKLIETNYFRFSMSVNYEDCKWYEIKRIANQSISQVTGPWSKDIPTDELEIYTGNYDFQIPTDLKPKRSAGNARAEGTAQWRRSQLGVPHPTKKPVLLR